MTVEELKKEIPTIKQKLESGEYRVVSIDGPQGPTGKTTAANLLRSEGIPVYEEWQLFDVRVGWNPKPKTAIKIWYEIIHDADKILNMIRKGHHGYRAVVVTGSYGVDDVRNALLSRGITVFRDSEILRLEFTDYISPAMRHQNFQKC